MEVALFINVIISFFIITTSLQGKEDHRVEHQPAALAEAMQISHQGVLKQKASGFVYLDVSNAFIDSLLNCLELPGELRPLPTAARSMGAHISVFNETEQVTPVELGETFSFEIKDIRSFTMNSRDGLKKLWVIAASSPELEALREKYGCPAKWKGYEFHITLGKQMPVASVGWENIAELSPFNFSNEYVSGLETEGDFVTVESGDLLTVVEKVNAIGQLKLKSNGYVYLDVNNAFVEKIAPLLPVDVTAKKIGAHISVMLEDEMIGHEIWNLAEAGQWFKFEVKQVRYVDRKGDRLWLLAVECPGLQRLRKHYGLKPKLQNRDFHITIGSQIAVEAA